MVALHALPAISARFPGSIGGTETRAWTLARGLARFETAISPTMIVRGRGVPEQFDGVRLIGKREPLCDWYVDVGRVVERKPGFPPVRVRRWSSSLLWKLPVVGTHWLCRSRPKDPTVADPYYARLKADAFVAFGVQSTAATVIASAHATSRPAIVVLGCDDDLDSRYMSDPQFVNPYGDSGRVCRWILENADAVLTQTKWQQSTLQKRFGRSGELVRNPIDLDVWTRSGNAVETGIAAIDSQPAPFALWVGRAEGVHKRPQKLVEMASLCPDVPFVMILNPADSALEQRVRGECPANVTIIDRVPPDRMPAVFQKASMLVNTSATEGFPNAFLQAAAMGLPVLSLAVLGPFLVENRLGLAFEEDVNAMATAVRSTYAQEVGDSSVSFDSIAARQFVQQHHGLESVTHQFAEAIRAVVS